MCYPIAARLVTCQTLTLEKLYHHIFSTPECDSTSIDHLKHDLVLWLNHHSFEELPDDLEYYLVDHNSDLEADLTHLSLLDQRGVQVVENLNTRLLLISCSQGILSSSSFSCYPLLRLFVYMYLSQLMRTFTNYLKCIVISS